MYTIELQRPAVGELFEAARGYGFTQVQFDYLSVGPEQLPAHISPALLAQIRRGALEAGISITAVNGTFNMIHPDPAVRADGLRRFEAVAQACGELGCGIVTLCTGTRCLESMWRWDEGNLAPEAWEDLLAGTEQVLRLAEKYELVLGVESEASNVVYNARQARRLLDAFESPRLKIIYDAANLFQKGQARQAAAKPVMEEAFELLAGDICLAHGKDVREGAGLDFTYAGNGIVDFDYFLESLGACGYTGGMILHGIKSEDYFPQAVACLRDALARTNKIGGNQDV